VTIIPGPSQVVIGNVTPAGLVTEFPPLPVPAGQDTFAGWQEMVSGPGGDLWFGDSVTGPVGPADGSLWFANEASGAIELGRITASGAATSYNLSGSVRRRFPFNAMALGQDGNLYLLANGNITARVYRLSPSELPPTRGAAGPQSRG
jgi:hypothetical protein